MTRFSASAAVIRRSTLFEPQIQAGTLPSLKRVTDPRDGRAVIVRRTERGWKANRAAAEGVAAIENEWAELLGPAKMKQLKSLLAELVAKLRVSLRGQCP